MNKQEKVSAGQLAALLLITDVFSLFCLRGEVSLATLLGFSAGIAVQAALSLPVITAAKKELPFGKAAKVLILIYLVLCGGEIFAMLWDTSEVIYVPSESSGGLAGRFMIAGLVALVCLYASSAGLGALSKAAVIAAAVGALCVAAVTVSAFIYPEWENMKNIENQRGFFGELLRGSAVSGGLGSFVYLLGKSKGSKIKNATVYFTGKLITTVVVLCVTMLVAGGIMEVTDFPAVTAAQLSQPFSVQRIDSLFLVVFAVFAVFAAAVQSVSAAEILRELLPKFKYLRSTAVLALMTGAAFIFTADGRLYPYEAAAEAMILLAVPIMTLCGGEERK